MNAHGSSSRKTYLNPARRGKRGLLIDVDPTTFDAFKHLADELNSSVEYLGHRAIALLFKELDVAVPDAVQERLKQPAMRHRGRRPKAEKARLAPR
jgi:hypothetical protein